MRSGRPTAGHIPPPVGLADLLRAADVLAPDAATIQLIGEVLLGPHRESTAPKAAPAQAPDLPVHPLVMGEEPRLSGPSTLPTASLLDDEHPIAVRTLELPPLPNPNPPRAGRSIAQLLGSEPPPPPNWALLPSLIEGAVLRTLAGTTLPGGDLDERAAVAALAQGRVLAALPRRPVHTTSRGLQLLLDGGAAMDPYRGDVEHLTMHMAKIIRADHLAEVWFEDCPLGSRHTVIGGDHTEWPYSLPPAGTPILTITAFGRRGRSARPGRAILAGWKSFLASARRAGNPLVILTPCPDALPPAMPRSADAVVSWGGPLNIRQALAAVRAADRAVSVSSSVPPP